MSGKVSELRQKVGKMGAVIEMERESARVIPLQLCLRVRENERVSLNGWM